MDVNIALRCPRCGSNAHNRYGKAPNGRQRFICLVCGRQFVSGAAGRPRPERPYCPSCHRRMHVYMHEEGATRFRCAAYPQCKTFVKVPEKKYERA